MEKRKQSVSLSFLLLRFTMAMLGSMLLCGLLWLFTVTWLQNAGIVYHGSVSNQQVEQLLSDNPETFVSLGDDFLPDYVLISPSGEVMESNVKGKRLEELTGFLKKDTEELHVSQHSYADGSTLIMRWHYRKEFVNPVLRRFLPPFEYLWWGVLGIAWVLCLIGNTTGLRRRLASKLTLFQEVSEKVGAQELDFEIPHAGIREYDQALDAMERMRQALYHSLSSQWAAQQEREAEIAALAHDLKTPLTLVGGNAELLLEEDELPDNCRKMVEKIAASNNRAKDYVTSLLETSSGAEEAFECISLPDLFAEVCHHAAAFAESERIHLQIVNHLSGTAYMQKEHMLRAIGNVVQNAMEHTPADKNVYLDGDMTESGWQITVRDEGDGFSQAALRHATERLWRDDKARAADGHNGLGLWFTAQVVKSHTGKLELSNHLSGGMVAIQFPQSAHKEATNANEKSFTCR